MAGQRGPLSGEAEAEADRSVGQPGAESGPQLWRGEQPPGRQLGSCSGQSMFGPKIGIESFDMGTYDPIESSYSSPAGTPPTTRIRARCAAANAALWTRLTLCTVASTSASLASRTRTPGASADQVSESCLDVKTKAGRAGPRPQAGEWPRLAEARGSLRRDLALRAAPLERQLAGACATSSST